jgi:Arc/MetJ-type ribon-helix-helix transcriptional regulator
MVMESKDPLEFETMEFEIDRAILKKLDELIAKGRYPSREQAMNDALADTVARHKDMAHERPSVIKIDVRIPADLKAQVDELIYLKIFPDFNDLVEKSLKKLMGE